MNKLPVLLALILLSLTIVSAQEMDVVAQWCPDCPEFMADINAQDVVLGGAIGALVAFGIFMMIMLMVASYVYIAWSWMTIAQKLDYKHAWLAWVPIANIAMMLHLGRFHWAWIFIILIPIAGWIALFVLFIIANWRIFEDRHYPGFYSLGLVIPSVGLILYLVAIGFVAWREMKPRRK